MLHFSYIYIFGIFTFSKLAYLMDPQDLNDLALYIFAWICIVC